MLSNKMTFSLTFLVMLLALVFAPIALAAVDTVPEVNLNVADVSSANGSQIEAYAAIVTTVIGSDDVTFNNVAVNAGNVDTAASIEAINTTAQTGNVVFYLKITNEGVAAVDERGANLINVVPTPNPNTFTLADPLIADESLHISDISITQYDKQGVDLMEVINNAESKIEHRTNAVRDGRNFKVTLNTADVNNKAAFMLVQLPENSFKHAAPADVAKAHFDKDKDLQWNKASGVLRLELVKAEPAGAAGNPQVVSLVRVADVATRGPDQGGTGVFSQAAVSGPFNVKITFTEEPNGKIEDIIDVKRGKVSNVIKGTPFYLRPIESEGNYDNTDTSTAVPLTTGRDRRYHSYLLEITPNLAKGDETVEIAVKGFDDLVDPPNSWSPDGVVNLTLAHNRYLLIVPVSSAAATKDIFKTSTDAKAGNETFIPDGLVIPAGGYLVLAQGTEAQSGVKSSPEKTGDKKGVQQLYNTKYEVAFSYPGDNLATFFRNGGNIELRHNDLAENAPAADATVNDKGYLLSNTSYDAESVVISEIMWGSDASFGDSEAHKSQWIELHNTTDAAISIDKNEWTLAFYQGRSGAGGADVIDEVGNAALWSVPGQSGATEALRTFATGDDTNALQTFETKTLVSMYRKMEGTKPLSGTSADSWEASPEKGSLNLSGLRAGTPGAANPTYTPKTDPPPDPPTPVSLATAMDLKITEIMVPSNGGILPQWIEIKNVSTGKVRLDGWQVSIHNDASDTDVITTSLSIDLSGVVLDTERVVLVVSKTGRNSGTDVAGVARTKGDANAGMFDADRIVNASVQLKPGTRNYSILSESAFSIALVPPSPITSGADSVGNLVGGWELPMSDAKGERSSIIRRKETAEITGTDAAGWVLFSETSLLGAYVETYYGDKDDMGTPGYDAIDALPVELSKFTAARDRATGQVVITWETQSELNNAGFFIKRNEHRTGQFKVVNPTMIPGAGTTSEKQSYTYTDTTAKPNIVYYYQIEDVSLDGNRQTLTRSHRLKGHIGAAGKLTTMWGELKEHE